MCLLSSSSSLLAFSCLYPRISSRSPAQLSLRKLELFSPLRIVESMAVRVVEFTNAGYKIRKIFAYELTYQRKLLNFENWVNGEVSKSAKFDFQSNFLLLTFFDNINF